MFLSIVLKWLSPVVQRLNQRMVWWPLGLFPIRAKVAAKKLRVQGRLVELTFPSGEFERQQWEFIHLYIDDPYGLKLLPSDLGTVLDVGGNIGLFALLARHYFPKAVIACYEPNPSLSSLIASNTQNVEVVVHREAVGAKEGTVQMLTSEDSLNGKVSLVGDGAIPLTAFRTAAQRLGGTIDLLKLDCEGGEWDIFKDAETLHAVHYLALEYHLEHENARSVSWLVSFLNDNGFRVTSLREAKDARIGQLTATNVKWGK